jgi:hypothetical protein
MADLHISNLRGIPVLARIGAIDRTVHPYYVRYDDKQHHVYIPIHI